MTPKQKLFVQKYIENGGNGTEAVLSAYNTSNRNSAKVIASKNLTLANVNQEIHQSLETKGIGVSFVLDKLKESMVAGIGVKATNSDTLRAIDVWARLTGAYKSPIVEESMKVKFQKMDSKTLRMEVEKIRIRHAQTLKDLN